MATATEAAASTPDTTSTSPIHPGTTATETTTATVRQRAMAATMSRQALASAAATAAHRPTPLTARSAAAPRATPPAMAVVTAMHLTALSVDAGDSPTLYTQHGQP